MTQHPVQACIGGKGEFPAGVGMSVPPMRIFTITEHWIAWATSNGFRIEEHEIPDTEDTVFAVFDKSGNLAYWAWIRWGNERIPD